MKEDAEKRLADIIHDLNTPLAAIRSSNDTMEAALLKIESGEAGESLAVIHDALRTSRLACERIIGVVKGVHQSAQLDIHRCIESSLELVAHLLDPRITVTREYGNLPMIQGDANQLSQVLVNLFVNAAHAIEGKGEIHIKTTQDAGTIRVAVTDNGRGIKAEDQSRIFERGFTTKPEGKGSGLGLSICQKIMNSHEARIEVKSEAGRGSTFTIVLPERKAS
jgi:signal transduction histidine kinase